MTEWILRQQEIDDLKRELETTIRERDQYREGWLSRGRRINGTGEFSDEGAWHPPETINRLNVKVGQLEYIIEEIIKAEPERAQEIARKYIGEQAE